jgi:hypothetical protein
LEEAVDVSCDRLLLMMMMKQIEWRYADGLNVSADSTDAAAD